MRILRTITVWLAVALHLGAASVSAAPRFVEICTAHGVTLVGADEPPAQEAMSCALCLAVCNAAALAGDAPEPFVPGESRTAQTAELDRAVARPAPACKSRGPPSAV